MSRKQINSSTMEPPIGRARSSTYSGLKIEVARFKPVTKGRIIASCTISIEGQIRLRDVLLLSEFDEMRVVMPCRLIGKRMVPAVELSRELHADVKQAILHEWAEHQSNS